MNLDLFSVSVVTALTVTTCGLLFIVETLIRRDEGAGRLWSIAFLFGILTTIAYGAWASGTGGVVAVAIGNAFFVATAGFMWLGARRFNQRTLGTGGVLVIVATVVSGAVVVMQWQELADWAGVAVMYACVTLFTGLGAAECIRRPMGRIQSAWALGVVMALVAIFYLGRLAVFLVWGPSHPLFATAFGSISANMVTIVLTIVGAVVTSVLRAHNVDPRAYAWVSAEGIASDGLLLHETFLRAMQQLSARATGRGELVAVVSVRIDDLGQIATAFGSDVVDEIRIAWRTAVRRFAPSAAFVGEDGARGILVSFVPATAAEARRHAAVIYRGLFDELGEINRAVIPVVGVGIALSETLGYDPDVLISNAQRTARRAAKSANTSVLFSGSVDAGGRIS